MGRVYPEVTDAVAAAMLASLSGKTPRTDDEWATAYFEFRITLHVGVSITLPNRVYDEAAQREVAEAIELLPRLHKRVEQIMAGDPDGIDWTGMYIDGDEIYLEYCHRGCNAQPGFSLSKACHGGPLRPFNFLTQWRTDTVVALASQIDTAHDFGAMPILADALQDAGCEQADILNHCRDPNHQHEPGCWVLELVLGEK
jgi:hypothetical protein